MDTDNHAAPPAGGGPSPLDELIGRAVVIDTGGPVVYIGTLQSVGPEGFWLAEADVRNCDEGHATREQYIVESRLHGVRVNRRRAFVLRHAAISLSALDDAVIE